MWSGGNGPSAQTTSKRRHCPGAGRWAPRTLAARRAAGAAAPMNKCLLTWMGDTMPKQST
eukprot:820344-Pyramimonas_sp.AAC.1